MKNACNFIKKETLAQVFSGEFCKISNTFFTEHLWTAVFKSKNCPGIDSWVQSRSNLGFIWLGLLSLLPKQQNL